jgi:ferredoxin-NADP reductase
MQAGGDGRFHVRMTTTVGTPVYRFKPGQHVTINSRYDSSLECRGELS